MGTRYQCPQKMTEWDINKQVKVVEGDNKTPKKQTKKDGEDEVIRKGDRIMMRQMRRSWITSPCSKM